jgi:hypothetical protein
VMSRAPTSIPCGRIISEELVQLLPFHFDIAGRLTEQRTSSAI